IRRRPAKRDGSQSLRGPARKIERAIAPPMRLFDSPRQGHARDWKQRASPTPRPAHLGKRISMQRLRQTFDVSPIILARGRTHGLFLRSPLTHRVLRKADSPRSADLSRLYTRSTGISNPMRVMEIVLPVRVARRQ